MKRRIFKLCLFLLLGAIISVAVAWGYAWLRPMDAVKSEHAYKWRSRAPDWIARELERRRCTGADRVTIQSSGWVVEHYGSPEPNCIEDLIPQWADGLGMPSLPKKAHTYDKLFGTGTRIVEARGWPMLSLRGGVWHRTSEMDWVKMGESEPTPEWDWAIPIPSTTSDPLNSLEKTRFLPSAPIWPGFAINTIFYAAILWLLFAAPFQFRRYRRIRRGLCSACAYPIRVGSSDVCTECGVAIPFPLRGRARRGGATNSSAMHERY